ncbi:MAG: LarC family nickel insertion protein [bacterium]|nr:LarC family nickel insertion protein [bacterium]
MTHLHLNPIGGLAGDMFCAALIDLRPELFAELRQLLPALGPPTGLELELTEAPGVLHGRCLRVRLRREPDHGHQHTQYSHIRRLLDGADMPAAVRLRAQAIFRELAEAEARVHGVEVERVTFHEVGNWDSIVDIVAAAFLLQRLQVSSCSCEPLPSGGGRVHTRHGWLPIPAPATAHLLQGMLMIDDGIGGERVTPTGAAILRALRPQPSVSGRLLTTGYGFGSRRLEAIPNCLQAQLLEIDTGVDYHSDSVLEIAFELDDQSPEDIGIGLERIRRLPGVLSLLLVDATGKQGRPTQQVQILAETTAHRGVVEACFRETRSIGLRYRQTSRWILQRREMSVQLPQGRIGVKLSYGPDGWRAKAESRDLSDFADHAQRQRLARLAEDTALQLNQEHESGE